MVIFEKIQDVTRSIARADYDQLETQIEELEQLVEKKNRSNLYLQYLTFAKGMLRYGRDVYKRQVCYNNLRNTGSFFITHVNATRIPNSTKISIKNAGRYPIYGINF